MAEKKPGSQKVVDEILKYNNEFVKSHDTAYFIPFSKEQNPLITLLSCSDSRVQPHVLLPDAVNRIFEIENIGNQILTSEGSVDYGIFHLHTPLLLIVGHSDCGAIKAYLNGYSSEPLSIQRELDYLWKSLSEVKREDDFEKMLLFYIQKNINYQTHAACAKYKNLIKSGDLTVIGAFYDFRNDFQKGLGRLIVLNVNGELDRNKIRNLALFKNIGEDLQALSIGV